jgi:hypothetical protein
MAQRAQEVVMELEVADHPEQERFEIRADGELAGFVGYRLHDGELALLHAETLTHFRHRGFAGRTSVCYPRAGIGDPHRRTDEFYRAAPFHGKNRHRADANAGG